MEKFTVKIKRPLLQFVVSFLVVVFFFALLSANTKMCTPPSHAVIDSDYGASHPLLLLLLLLLNNNIQCTKQLYPTYIYILYVRSIFTMMFIYFVAHLEEEEKKEKIVSRKSSAGLNLSLCPCIDMQLLML